MWTVRTAVVISAVCVLVAASLIVSQLVAKSASKLQASSAEMPWGIVSLGTTHISLSVRLPTWRAVRMTLPLLGKIMTCLAATALTAASNSSVLGFMV